MGERIRSRRKLLGMTLDDLDERSGISKHSLSRIENGRQEAKALTLTLISLALETTTDFLCKGTSPNKEPRSQYPNPGIFTEEEVDKFGELMENMSYYVKRMQGTE